jgi:hypothetical protein
LRVVAVALRVTVLTLMWVVGAGLAGFCLKKKFSWLPEPTLLPLGAGALGRTGLVVARMVGIVLFTLPLMRVSGLLPLVVAGLAEEALVAQQAVPVAVAVAIRVLAGAR